MGQNGYDPLGVGVGSRIGNRYEIERKLGSGGMSAVFLARDLALNNDLCALKILEPRLLNNSNDLERFRNEVVITRKLTHSNIVRTFEFGRTESNQYFITMEYVQGESLHQLIYSHQQSPLLFPQILRYLHSIASGIAYAHEHGVIHRDLKPANVLVSTNGEVKIGDFGLAQTTEVQLQLTQAGECVGTPAYMAPEQVQGNDADERSDIYALGILGYEMLSGSLPFAAPDWYSLASQIINDPLPSLGSQNKRLPGWFQAFIIKATAKDPEERWSSAGEVVELISEHLDDTHNVHIRTRKNNRQTTAIFSRMGSALGSSLMHNGPALMVFCLVLTLFMVVIGTGVGKNSVDKATANVGRNVGTNLESMAKRFDKSATALNRFVNAGAKAAKLAGVINENHEEIDAALEKAIREKEAKKKLKTGEIKKESEEEEKEKEEEEKPKEIDISEPLPDTQ